MLDLKFPWKIASSGLLASSSSSAWPAPPFLGRVSGEADGLGPVHLAYLAAALLLPARLLLVLRARADVPRLHAELRDGLERGEPEPERPLRQRSNPYADLAGQLITASRSGRPADEITQTRQRAVRKAARRNLRSQTLDAASLLLLLSLSLAGGRVLPLGEPAAWGAGFIGLMLLCTIFARASLHHRLDTALRELEDLLRRSPRSPSLAFACAFCGADVDSTPVAVTLEGHELPLRGVLCRSCGKVVASVPTRELFLGTAGPKAVP